MADGSTGDIPMAPRIRTHLTQTKVTLNDVLEHLSSVTQTPSSFGSQLERARDGTTGAADYVLSKEKAEMRLLANAAVIRCVDALSAMPNIFRTGEACNDIRKFAVRAGMREGAAVIAVMRSYQPWDTLSKERGLAAVYEWARSRNPMLKPADPAGETTVAQAFRVGKAKRARTVAVLLLADAEVALSAWVERWNRQDREPHYAFRKTPAAA